MRREFDYIVIGCGGIGSGAAYWLSREAGADVLGIEQFAFGHDSGGSQDHSRIIRLMYHEARYTALTPHTYTAWETIEAESGVQVVLRTGGVEIASGDYRQDIDRYATALDAADIPYERFDTDELRRRYPQFHADANDEVLFDPAAGLVDAAKGNAVHVSLARARGATMLDQCPVQAIHPFGNDNGGGVDVVTERGVFTAKKLIVASGAWTNQVLAEVGLHIPVTVTQEQVTWYATPHLRDFAPERFPIFIWKDKLDYYGFPVYGEVATKAGIDASGPSVTTESRSYEPDVEREAALTEWLERHVPRFVGPKLYTKSCLYTMPHDRDFVLDTVPGHPQILVCVGAGHAYKFASLLGKTLSELAVDGTTNHDISGFTAQRPAIVDPAFEAAYHI